MLQFTDEQFERIKESGEEAYRSFRQVWCPYFREYVVFNAKGLEHLKFKSKNHARSRDDQYIRFRLLELAPKVLGLSRTVQGVSERKIFELTRTNQRSEYLLVEAVFYEFVAVIERVRVRIIIKEIINGPRYFWSIIPHWKMGIDKKRKLFTGNPEED